MNRLGYDVFRICRRRRSQCIFLFLLICMLADLVYTFVTYRSNYQYLTFLTVGASHVLQILLIWLMPIWILLAVGDRYIEDVKLGFSSLISTRYGMGRYVRKLVATTFVTSFLLYFIPLLMNYGFALVLGWNVPKMEGIGRLHYEMLRYDQRPMAQMAWYQPGLVNIMFLFSTCFLAGFLGTVSVCISLVFPDKRVVYSFMFVFWFGQIILPKSVIDVVQPFTEWQLERLGYVYGRSLLLCLVVIVPCLFVVARRKR